MRQLRFLFVAAAIVGLCGPWVSGQDKAKSKDDKDAPAKFRGQLPANWGKLSLSDEQKQKVYEVQGKFQSKIDALAKQIKDLKDEEKKEMEHVLTEAQKARLRELLAGKAPASPKDKDK